MVRGGELLSHLNALPVHGPEGRIYVARTALGLKQVEFATEIRAAGGRASRETVSHWENLTENGSPRARLTRRNAAAVAQIVRDRLGIEVGEQMFFEPDETAWDGLERRQVEMAGQLQLLIETVERLERELAESRRRLEPDDS